MPNAISYVIGNQKNVALSCTGAEYVALSETLKETIYLTKLLSEINEITFKKVPIHLLIDILSSEKLAYNP